MSLCVTRMDISGQGIFFARPWMLSRSAGQQEGRHRRANERAAGICARHASGKAENGSHICFTRDRPVRAYAPAKRLDRDRVSSRIDVPREYVRFRKSLYVNEEASYREASFVDCDGQFTSTCRTLSTAIVSPKTICPGRPQATNGVEKSLAILRRAVNPRIARRLPGSIILAPAAPAACLPAARHAAGEARRRSTGNASA